MGAGERDRARDRERARARAREQERERENRAPQERGSDLRAGTGPPEEQYRIFVPCARYLEPILAGELTTLGLAEIKETKAGVSCSGSMEELYRICLWSRTASRVLLLLAEGPAATEAELYETAASIDWERHFSPDSSISVSASSAKSALHNTSYAALKIKDGIVDTFRARFGRRPSVSSVQPDTRFYGRIEENRLKLYLDASGEALHRRGYRLEKTEAPLRETAAAAMLLKAGWPEIAADGGIFLDPMCGSGTLAIEAGLIATGTAPGLLRDSFGFESWKQHDPELWKRVREQAERTRTSTRSRLSGRECIPRIHASDKDTRAVDVCRENVRRAGLENYVSLRVSDFRELDTEALLCRTEAPTAGARPEAEPRDGDVRPEAEPREKRHERPAPGLVACNPPYGIRLEDEQKVRRLYEELGSWLKGNFEGWRAAVLTAGKGAARYIGLRADRVLKFYNGSIEGALALFDLDESNEFRPCGEAQTGASSASAAAATPGAGVRSGGAAQRSSGARSSREAKTGAEARSGGVAPQTGDETAGVQSIVNRLRKNRRNLRKYLRKREISCYRIYDADIPQYAAAVDVYEDTYFVIQEYAPPKKIDEESAEFHLRELTQAVITFFQADETYVFVKQRRRREGGEQYEKLSEEGEFYVVREGGLRFFVNFTDYLDTGLFLDHRIARGMIREQAEGRRVLNLFAYTCTASVYAAAGGAASVVSVDTSNTYLEWGKKNFGLNRLETGNAYFVREDAMEYLRRRSSAGSSASASAPAQAQAQAPAPTPASTPAPAPASAPTPAPAGTEGSSGSDGGQKANAQEVEAPEGNFDLIFIDPPTYSNRKDAAEDFDLQRDHEELILLAAGLLSPGGFILFSNNFRRFELSPRIAEEFSVRDISQETVPKDFSRNAKIHHAWIIEASR